MLPVRRFEPGQDRIGVIAPSDSIVPFPRRTSRAIKSLNRLTGSEIVFAANARGKSGQLSGSARERNRDLDEMLNDSTIGLILSATGGYNSLEVGCLFDPCIFFANPKPIVGFSDTTALLNDIFRQTGHVTFHGPALLSGFGGAEPDNRQAELLLALVSRSTTGKELSDPEIVSESFQLWDCDDDIPPPHRAMESRICVGKGAVEGHLVGGNLDTLVVLAAAGRLPDTTGAIVFLEAAFCSYEKVARDLVALDQHGMFDRATGIVMGLPFQVEQGCKVFSLIAGIANNRDLPLVYGASIGHTSPIVPLPIGARVCLNPSIGSLTIMEEVTL